MDKALDTYNNIIKFTDNNAGIITLISLIVAIGSLFFDKPIPKWIVFGISIVIIIIVFTHNIVKNKYNNHEWKEKYIDDNIPNDLLKYLPKEKLSNKVTQTEPSDAENIDGNIYIQPYIRTVKSIVNGTNHLKITTPSLLRDFFLNEVFVKRSNYYKHNGFLLLGDSGTGKTAALVHLFHDYIYRHTNLPYEIRLFSLGMDDVFEDINNVDVKNKKKCILLLDALDENPMAQKPKESKEYKSFIHQIEKVYTDFAFVITTCRPQFFSEEKKMPDTPNITKIELVPFNKAQIDEFLEKTFSISNEAEKRYKAVELIKKQPEIAKRPIILTYIRGIVESNHEIETTLDLFDTIVDYLLCRDINKVLKNFQYEEKDKQKEQIQQWWDMSSEVAGYMYKLGKTEISNDDLFRFFYNHTDQLNNTLNEDLFQRRSLLTCTANGFEFSHKSFYEYFMAYRFLQHPDEIKKVYGMDFALQLYNEAFKAWYEKKETPFANLKETDHYIVAHSLNYIGLALFNINHFNEAEPKYQTAKEIFRTLEKNNPDLFFIHIANVLNNMAGLYWKKNQFDDAEKNLTEALGYYQQLAEEKPNTYLPSVAMVLNNLGNIYYSTNQYEFSEKRYNEALDIRRQLAKKEPETYLSGVADTLNNLGELHRNTHQYEDSEKESRESLYICVNLAKKYPDTYLPDVAMTLSNLGLLYIDTKQYNKAEEKSTKALRIRQQLAKKNPDAYLPDVASTLNNLGDLYYEIEQYEDAEKKYNEALTILRQLSEQNPDAYFPRVANTLNSLSILHHNTNRYEEADNEFSEALTIRHQLAEKYPDAFLPDVAQTLYNLALLYRDKNDLPAAEDAAQESLDIFKKKAEMSHAAFDPWVEKVEELLEHIQKAKKAAE